MSREEIYEQLNEVFRDVFDDDTIEVNLQGYRGLGLPGAYQSDCCNRNTVWNEVYHGTGCYHEKCWRDGGYHLIPDPVIQSSQEKRSSGKPRDADRWRVPVWETPS